VTAGVVGAVVLAFDRGAEVGIWSLAQRPGWGDAQVLALAGAALVIDARFAFPQGPIVPIAPAVDFLGHGRFAAGSVALLSVGGPRVRDRALAVTVP
jgi:hypothetical protein